MICGATHAALQRSAMVWVRYAGRVWVWQLGPKAMALRWWHVGTRGLAGQRHSTRHYALGTQVFAPGEPRSPGGMNLLSSVRSILEFSKWDMPNDYFSKKIFQNFPKRNMLNRYLAAEG